MRLEVAADERVWFQWFVRSLPANIFRLTIVVILFAVCLCTRNIFVLTERFPHRQLVLRGKINTFSDYT